MIEVKNLEVSISNKQILKGVNMKFKLGKNYCLLGRNGSGKSTLSAVLAGSPKYEVESGEIFITPPLVPLTERETSEKGGGALDLLDLSPDERSKEGIFLSFQNIPEIPGIKLGEFLRTIYNIHLKNKKSSHYELDSESSKNYTESSSVGQFMDISPFIFKRHIKKYLEELKIDENLLDRDLNVGFSGGEKRKIEILQMKLIGPKYIILDEIDSGLDLDAFKKVCKMLKKLDNENNTFIIITHYFKILDYLDIDKVFILEDGKVVKNGKKALIEEIKKNGYES